MTLKDGTGSLKEGSDKLSDGVDKLLDGAEDLRDGMDKFADEGISKICDAIDKDGQEFVDRLKALRDYGKEYTNFSGKADGVSGSVKFIMRTESIGDEDLDDKD